MYTHAPHQLASASAADDLSLGSAVIVSQILQTKLCMHYLGDSIHTVGMCLIPHHAWFLYLFMMT